MSKKNKKDFNLELIKSFNTLMDTIQSLFVILRVYKKNDKNTVPLLDKIQEKDFSADQESNKLVAVISDKINHYVKVLLITKAETMDTVIDEVADVTQYFSIDKRVLLFSVIDSYSLGETMITEKIVAAQKQVDNINKLVERVNNSKNDVYITFEKEFHIRLNNIGQISPNKFEDLIITGKVNELRSFLYNDSELKKIGYSDIEIMWSKYFLETITEAPNKYTDTSDGEIGKRLFLAQGNKNNIAEYYLLKAICNGDTSIAYYLMQLYMSDKKWQEVKKLYLTWKKELINDRMAKSSYARTFFLTPTQKISQEIKEYFVESIAFISKQPASYRESLLLVNDTDKDFLKVLKNQNDIFDVPLYKSIVLFDDKLREYVYNQKLLQKLGLTKSAIKHIQNEYGKFDFNRESDLKNTIERVIRFIGLHDKIAINLYNLLLKSGERCTVSDKQSAIFNFIVELFSKNKNVIDSWPHLSVKMEASLLANLSEEYKYRNDVESISEFLVTNFKDFAKWYDEATIYNIMTGNNTFTKADKDAVLVTARAAKVFGIEEYYSNNRVNGFSNDSEKESAVKEDWFKEFQGKINKENKLYEVLKDMEINEDNLYRIYQEFADNDICLKARIRNWLWDASLKVGMQSENLKLFHSKQEKILSGTDSIQYMFQVYLDALKNDYLPKEYEDSVEQYCNNNLKNRYAFVCLCYLYAKNGKKYLADTIFYLFSNDSSKARFSQDLRNELLEFGKRNSIHKSFKDIFISFVDPKNIHLLEERFYEVQNIFKNYPNKKYVLGEKFRELCSMTTMNDNSFDSESQNNIFELLCYKYGSDDVNVIWDIIKKFVLDLPIDVQEALCIFIIRYDIKNLKREDKLHYASNKFVERGAFCKVLKEYKNIKSLIEEYEKYYDGFNVISASVSDERHNKLLRKICATLDNVKLIYSNTEEIFKEDNIKSNFDEKLKDLKNYPNDWLDVKKHIEFLLQDECDVLSRQPRLEVEIFDQDNILLVGRKAYIYGVVKNKGNCLAKNLILKSKLNNNELAQEYSMRELKPDNVGYFQIVCDGVDEAPYAFEATITYEFKNQKSYYEFNDCNIMVQKASSESYLKENNKYSTDAVRFELNDNGTDVIGKGFFGRKSETRKLRSLVKGKDFVDCSSAIIYGERRTGKTTLLSYLHKYIRSCCNNAISIKFDAMDRKTIKEVFVTGVLREIRFEYLNDKRLDIDIDEWNKLEYKWNNKADFNGDISLADLKEFYIELFNVTQIGLMVLIDEFDAFLKDLPETGSNISIDALFRAMISMIEDERCRSVVHFVFCGSNELEHIANTGSNRQQLFQKLAENKIVVGVLTQDDTNSLLTSIKDWEYTADALEMMWHYTEGAVFYVKLLANKVIEFAADKRKRNKIYPYDVVDNVSKILDETNFRQFNEWYGFDESNYEKQVVNAIQLKSNEKGKYVSYDEINSIISNGNIDLEASIKKLMNYHIIKKHKDSKKYRFDLELLRQYFRTMDSDGIKEPDLEPKFELNSISKDTISDYRNDNNETGLFDWY